MECPKCRGYAGWICERHPDKPFMHDDCGGAGMPCDEPGCEHSLIAGAGTDARVSLISGAPPAGSDDNDGDGRLHAGDE